VVVLDDLEQVLVVDVPEMRVAVLLGQEGKPGDSLADPHVRGRQFE
jgi:hypothetical protein